MPATVDEVSRSIVLSLRGVADGGLKVSPSDALGQLVLRGARRQDLGSRDLPVIRGLEDGLAARQADRDRQLRGRWRRRGAAGPRVFRR